MRIHRSRTIQEATEQITRNEINEQKQGEKKPIGMDNKDIHTHNWEYNDNRATYENKKSNCPQQKKQMIQFNQCAYI